MSVCFNVTKWCTKSSNRGSFNVAWEHEQLHTRHTVLNVSALSHKFSLLIFPQVPLREIQTESCSSAEDSGSTGQQSQQNYCWLFVTIDFKLMVVLHGDCTLTQCLKLCLITEQNTEPQERVVELLEVLHFSPDEKVVQKLQCVFLCVLFQIPYGLWTLHSSSNCYNIGCGCWNLCYWDACDCTPE